MYLNNIKPLKCCLCRIKQTQFYLCMTLGNAQGNCEKKPHRYVKLYR